MTRKIIDDLRPDLVAPAVGTTAKQQPKTDPAARGQRSAVPFAPVPQPLQSQQLQDLFNHDGPPDLLTRPYPLRPAPRWAPVTGQAIQSQSRTR